MTADEVCPSETVEGGALPPLCSLTRAGMLLKT